MVTAALLKACNLSGFLGLSMWMRLHTCPGNHKKAGQKYNEAIDHLNVLT